jgi:hypothetical protein
MNRIFFTSLFLLVILTANAQNAKSDSVVKKTGWFIFSEQQVYWVETPLSKTVKHKDFFKQTVYKNGLRWNGSYKAMYFSFLAKEYQNDTYKNLILKSAYDSSLRYFWLLPVTATLRYTSPLDFPEDEGEKVILSGTKKVTVLHKWERNYLIINFNFLRKEDSMKAAKHLAKLKVPPDEYYGQKGFW